MAWMPGIPHDQGSEPQGSIIPAGVVAHRTYGSWNGDYAVGKGSNPPVGFHFLIGKAEGRWVQFYDTTTRCAHGGSNANANDISVGIEVEGRNDEPMTPWQIDRVRDIVSWLKATHNIALAYRFSTAHDLRADYGYIPHSAVKGSDHSDLWTVDDWNRIVNGAGGTIPDEGDDMAITDDDAVKIAYAVWSLIFDASGQAAHTHLRNADAQSSQTLTEVRQLAQTSKDGAHSHG